jgi:hypothetical protein
VRAVFVGFPSRVCRLRPPGRALCTWSLPPRGASCRHGLRSCCALLFCAVSALHRVSALLCRTQPRSDLLVSANVARSIVHPLLPLGILVPFSKSVSDLLFFSVLLLCNMSANTIVVNIVLDGQNYSEWAFCVQTALRGHCLLFHLTEDSPVLASRLGRSMMAR